MVAPSALGCGDGGVNESLSDAAQHWVDGGVWSHGSSVSVVVWRRDDGGSGSEQAVQTSHEVATFVEEE